jgi:predicted transcriptional regulator
VNRKDVSDITAEIRSRDADPTDTIDEFPVASFAVTEETRRPELLVNDDFDTAEIENEERAERLKQVDEMVRSDKPYYEVINKVGLGRDIDNVRRDNVATELMERGYVTQTLDGEYRLTDRGRRMHTLFSDYIYGDPG